MNVANSEGSCGVASDDARSPYTASDGNEAIILKKTLSVRKEIFFRDSGCNRGRRGHVRGMKISTWCLRLALALSAGVLVMGSGRKPDPHPPVSAKESDRVRVKDFAKEYGFAEVKVEEDHVWLKGKVHELRLYKDSRKVDLNGSMVWLNEAMVVENRWWTLSKTDVEKSLRPLIRPVEALAGAGFKVVVLDPGHGGEDSGALSPRGLQEKTVVLDITRRVRALLLEAGFTVYVTRHDDRFVELGERTRRAEAWKADLFVSLHANSGPKSAKGTESFALSLPGYGSTNRKSGAERSKKVEPGNRFDGPNMALAFALHHALHKGVGFEDRGVRRARFKVLREAPCPAALVEVGFLSHAEEGAKLAQAAIRAKVAHSIAQGIENYARGVKRAAVLSESSTKKDES